MDLKELNAQNAKVKDKEFIEIIHRLIEEKKDIQKRLDIVEEILHSYIPLIEKKKEK